MEKNEIRGRQRARKLALQALYQWLMSNTDIHEIEAQFRTINNMDKVDINYFQHLLYGIPKELTTLEESLSPFLDRKVNELNPVERTVLRMGAFELIHCLEIPYKIILEEAVSLSKSFGSQDGFKYVNGVLNNLARNVRKDEING